MTKRVRILFWLFFLAVGIGVAGVGASYWIAEQSVRSAMSEGGGLSQIVDATEAELGATLARGDVRLPLRDPSGVSAGEGVMPYYS